jgi:hypothetical protein
MKKELQEKLYNDYPDIFRERTLSPQVTCMCWGIDCEDGWYHIIDRLCLFLTTLENKTNCEIIAQQVKEKFGGLRFYYYIAKGNEKDFDIINKLIWAIEELSFKVCEICGNSGTLCRRGTWYKTLCEEHMTEGYEKVK